MRHRKRIAPCRRVVPSSIAILLSALIPMEVTLYTETRAEGMTTHDHIHQVSHG